MVMVVALGILVMTMGAPAAADTEQLAVKSVSVSGAIVLRPSRTPRSLGSLHGRRGGRGQRHGSPEPRLPP
jgi:hypothetical protein